MASVARRAHGPGIVAAGDPATAAAAVEILEDGGNAFDAALAAMAAACVAEPVLASLGGGGFLLADPTDGPPRLYDFFVQTPKAPRPAEDVDFRPILADFGTATQEFHIGLGAAAVPGVVAGLFAVQRDLCRLGPARLLAPAIALADGGVAIAPMQARIMEVVEPILRATPAAQAVFAGGDGGLIGLGQRFCWPDLARALEALAAEGPRLFYEGAIAAAIVDACAAQGGYLTADDLRGYCVHRRDPMTCSYRGATIMTNPPPAAGGPLIVFSLALADHFDFAATRHGDQVHLDAIARILAVTETAREDSDLAEDAHAGAGYLADRAVLSRYLASLQPQHVASRGTTHISVLDGDGNAASVTLSNGEGCGAIIADAGCMLNNMLGEQDLNPRGFHRWQPDRRLSSMMAPTIVQAGDGTVTALGSGGSNRIRSAILQVLVNMLDFAMPPDVAVAAPRLHLEAGTLDIETGYGEASVSAAANWSQRYTVWPEDSFFFGGVHAVQRRPDATVAGAGDHRRGGVARQTAGRDAQTTESIHGGC
ncbi:MAG: gamma-glutamyltransferase [Rhodospirillaceae bacterium]|nr:gamma-glutamyltransferase [Rhodospirillaceae bacterium]